jgi:glycosyltransferase involved in cell wall biosynthesis
VRIRFHSYFYPPCVGGGEVILRHQAEGLAARGHEVHVHTTPYANLNLSRSVACGDALEAGVHVHRRPSRRIPFRNPLEADALTPAFLGDAWRAADLLVCVGYPSVHLHALAARARATRTPLVVQNYVTEAHLASLLSRDGGAHRRLRAAYWRTWVRRELACASLVLADSPGAARALEERLGLDNVHTHIGMAVDPAEFDAVTPDERARVRARLALGSDRIVLAPSRFSSQKGADLLVDAMAPLLRGPKGQGWRLVIPGAVNDATFAADVRAAARALGDRVAFAPDDGLPRRELVALFRESDVVVLPSRGETVGGVVFEGMYAGAVTVVSDAVEAARDDYLRHDVNGRLYRSGDVASLRDALAWAMRSDTAHVRAHARAMVEARFTWSASLDRLENLYAEARRRAAEGRP